MNLDPIKPYADLIRAGLWLLVLLALVGLGYALGSGRWHGKYDVEVAAHVATKAKQKRVLDDLAERTAAVAKQARAASDAAKLARRDNDSRYDQAVEDAKRARAALRDALRAGDQRLQPWWDCAAGPSEGDAAALAGGPDAAAGLRQEGAADLVASGYNADAWIVWLQTELISTRKAVIDAGCAVEPPTAMGRRQ